MIRRFFGARVFGFLGNPASGTPPVSPNIILTETSENLKTETGEDLITEG